VEDHKSGFRAERERRKRALEFLQGGGKALKKYLPGSEDVRLNVVKLGEKDKRRKKCGTEKTFGGFYGEGCVP